MTLQEKRFSGLTGNQLKLMALLTMTIDHIGADLLPHLLWLRIIGRLAFPIYAYMIAEGCRYTRSRPRYLLSMASLALVCQLVYFFAEGSLYQCILVTFSLSICLIYVLDWVMKRSSALGWCVLGAVLAVMYFLGQCLPMLGIRDLDLDYGFWGIVLPALVYVGKTKWQKLLLFTAGLAALAADSFWVQWFSLAAVPLLALYGGSRGKVKMKYLFYIYYPLHLVAIHLIAILWRKY